MEFRYEIIVIVIIDGSKMSHIFSEDCLCKVMNLLKNHFDPSMVSPTIVMILVDKGLLVKPIPSKGKHRLESLRGFFKHEGVPISDEVLFSPVDYNESRNIT